MFTYIGFTLMLLVEPAHAYPYSIPVPEDGEKPVHQTSKVKTQDKIQLFVHSWKPEKFQAGKPVVVLLHGIGLHGEPYESIAYGFTSRGMVLVAPDLRGHGRSEGEKMNLAVAHVLRADLQSIIRWVKKEYPKSPVYLVGESMGGLIAADFALNHQKELAGLILLAPAFKVHESRVRMPNLKDVLNNQVTIDSKENLRASSRVAGFVNAKYNDPLCTHRVKSSYILNIVSMQLDWPKSGEHIKIPTMFHLAGNEKINDNDAIKQAYRRLSTPEKQKVLKEWDGAFHTLFWDPVTPKVVQSITDWIDKQGK